MKVIIDRIKWWRGQGPNGSKLLRDDGKMCCLGFLGLNCGLNESQIKDKAYPYEVLEPALYPSQLINGVNNIGLSLQICAINDSTFINDGDRELKLKKAFSEMDIEIEFIN